LSILTAINNNDMLKILPKILKEYEEDCSQAPKRLKINDNRLNEANREHSGWQLRYDEQKSELHILSKYMDILVGKARSKLYVGYTQTHNRELTEQGKKQYIEGEPAYINANIRSLEVKELLEKFQAISEAFKTRGYALNNLTKLTIANIEDISF
jgi:hypothetical protein